MVGTGGAVVVAGVETGCSTGGADATQELSNNIAPHTKIAVLRRGVETQLTKDISMYRQFQASPKDLGHRCSVGVA